MSNSYVPAGTSVLFVPADIVLSSDATAAEAEVKQLRAQLAISGGPRLGQLLADLDAALARARA